MQYKKLHISWKLQQVVYTVFRKKHPCTFSSVSPWTMFVFVRTLRGMFMMN